MKPATSTHAPNITVSLLLHETQQCAGHGLDGGHFERALLSGAREFLARPGKAFRARMIEACFLVAGGAAGTLPDACLEAIELLHGGSLIVDDIQDEAETRRGAPALHKLVGMPRALNIGNWLYFVALSRIDALPLEPAALAALSRAAHLCLMRCHEGQALDLTLRIGELKRHEVPAVAHTTSLLKTGALMGLAARLGASVAHAPNERVQALVQFGERAGVGLQMLDDLGSFASPAREHKALEDLVGQRVSWVWAWASEVLDEVSFKQLARQVSRAENLEHVRARLSEVVESLGRVRVHAALSQALSELEGHVGNTPALQALASEMSRLEKSYG